MNKRIPVIPKFFGISHKFNRFAKFMKDDKVQIFIRLLWKLTYADEMQRKYGAQNLKYHIVHEDLSTKAAQQFQAKVSFQRSLFSFSIYLSSIYNLNL